MSNISVGSVYALGDRIPSFKVLNSMKTKESYRLYYGQENLNIESIITEYKDDTQRILASDNFFRTYSWLENNIAKIRTVFRESFLSNEENLDSKLKSELGIFVLDEYTSLNNAIIECKEAESLLQVEEILDDTYFQILKNNSSRINSSTRSYLSFLRSQHELDRVIRKNYLNSSEIIKNSEVEESNSEEELIKYLNKSILTGDETYLTLRLIHRVKLFTYNLRIQWNHLDSELLINYDAD